MKLSSTGLRGDGALDVPRKDYHAITIADRELRIEPQFVPEGRPSASDAAVPSAAGPVAGVPTIQVKDAAETKRPVSGQPPPEIAAQDWIRWSGEKPPTLASLAGKVVVVEFSATWCRPCVPGIPHLSELQEKYAEKGLVILSADEPDEEGRRGVPGEAAVTEVRRWHR